MQTRWRPLLPGERSSALVRAAYPCRSAQIMERDKRDLRHGLLPPAREAGSNNLRLVEARMSGSGVVLLHHERAGAKR
jgi:hypothetical protein